MKLLETGLQDCYSFEPKLFGDERGYFFESHNNHTFKQLTGLEVNFVQDNQSFSKYGVLRGLHFQTGVFAQAKLVRVLKGKILDVAVDLRKNSPTFGKHFSIELSSENKKQLFVPKGFAHGFVVISEVAEVFYKCDNYYNKESESGILYNDPQLNINWMLEEKELLLSEKDQLLPNWNQYLDLTIS
jgi:dTDP-4-dehydrorhamnose 3,5-epimerase